MFVLVYCAVCSSLVLVPCDSVEAKRWSHSSQLTWLIKARLSTVSIKYVKAGYRQELPT